MAIKTNITELKIRMEKGMNERLKSKTCRQFVLQSSFKFSESADGLAPSSCQK
jgi:hypothetical protein